MRARPQPDVQYDLTAPGSVIEHSLHHLNATKLYTIYLCLSRSHSTILFLSRHLSVQPAVSFFMSCIWCFSSLKITFLIVWYNSGSILSTRSFSVFLSWPFNSILLRSSPWILPTYLSARKLDPYMIPIKASKIAHPGIMLSFCRKYQNPGDL